MAKMVSVDERMAKVEGILEQISLRLGQLEAPLNHLEVRLDQKADKWEVRIWFILITALVAAVLARI